MAYPPLLHANAKRIRNIAQSEFPSTEWEIFPPQPYLKDSKSIVSASHKEPECTLRKLDASNRLPQCRMQPSKIDFDIFHWDAGRDQNPRSFLKARIIWRRCSGRKGWPHCPLGQKRTGDERENNFRAHLHGKEKEWFRKGRLQLIQTKASLEKERQLFVRCTLPISKRRRRKY